MGRRGCQAVGPTPSQRGWLRAKLSLRGSLLIAALMTRRTGQATGPLSQVGGSDTGGLMAEG